MTPSQQAKWDRIQLIKAKPVQAEEVWTTIEHRAHDVAMEDDWEYTCKPQSQPFIDRRGRKYYT